MAYLKRALKATSQDLKGRGELRSHGYFRALCSALLFANLAASISFAQSSSIPKAEGSSQLNVRDLKKDRNTVDTLPKNPAAASSLSLSEVETLPSQIFGQVRFENMHYLTSIPDSPQLTNSQLLSARLSMVRERPHYDLAADFSAGTFFSVRRSHFVVHEIYASFKAAQTTAYVGRKKAAWSEMDMRWQLGLWQPRFAMDTLRPEEQGLTGIFLDHSTENFQLIGFASPIYVPSMGPDIREEGGSLVADSRWYRTPSREYNFNTRTNSISYKLDIPAAARLVNNPGSAISMRLGNKSNGAWGVASAGSLPVNDLVLKRKVFKSASADVVDATVSPEVGRHTLVSADVGYTYGDAKISASYLQDNPEEKRPDPEWSIQKLLPIKAYSAAIDFTVAPIFSRSLAFQLSYLKVEGGGIQDIIADGSNDDFTLFDQRLIFTNAVAASVEGLLARIYRRDLVARFKYLYDYDQLGSLLSTEFLYYPTQKVAVVLGADILGVQDENSNPNAFLNQYRANDRVYGGLTYVF